MENFREKRLERQLKSQQNISIIVAVVLLLAILGIVYLWVRNNRLNEQKQELEREKTMLMTDVRTIEESNAQLQSRISAQEEQIEVLRENVAELELELQSRENHIARMVRELVKMEDLHLEIAKYESLEEEHEKLKDEKLELLGELEAVREQLSQMEDRNEALGYKIEEATFLKAYNICVHNFKDRWICRPVVMEVARRVDRTTLSFEVSENQFIEPGEKNIHLVVTGPDGNVISPSAESFTIEETGENSNFTEYTTIQYDNQPVQLDFTIEHDTNPEPGRYQVKVFLDGSESGTGEFMLE